MALIQDILSQLQTMGIGTGVGGYAGLSGITPGQISTGLSQSYGIPTGDLPSAMFPGISQEMLRGGMASTYSPMIQATGQSLLGDLSKEFGGQAGRVAAGGFAGSGQRGRHAQQAKDVYGKGMTDVLSQSQRQRTESHSSIMDLINQWRTSALKIRGDM